MGDEVLFYPLWEIHILLPKKEGMILLLILQTSPAIAPVKKLYTN